MGNANSGRRGRPMRPATTIEGREMQLISLADQLVERRLREGTASAQETLHYLKLGSTRERLEQEKLRSENLLTAAKLEQIHSGARMEELYEKALGAMREYKGEVVDDNGYDD